MAANSKQIRFRLSDDSEVDIEISKHLEQQENITYYLKELIKRDIKGESSIEKMISEIRDVVKNTITETLRSLGYIKNEFLKNSEEMDPF